MLKKIAIVGIVLGVLGLIGCQSEHQGEGQAVNAAALDSLRQVISSLEQELNTVKEEKQQCEAELESLKSQKQAPVESKTEEKPKVKTVSTNNKISAGKPKQVETSESPKKTGGRANTPVDLNR